MEECVFCKLVRKESDCHMIYESDSIMSFLDIDPIHEGHVLIIPKIHCASIEKVPLETLKEMMALAQKIVKAYNKTYKLDGYSIMQNGGEFCDFGHFHLHIFPRYQNDGFGWKYPEGPFESSEEVANKIRQEL